MGRHIWNYHRDALKTAYQRYDKVKHTTSYPFIASGGWFYCFECKEWWTAREEAKAKHHYEKGKCNAEDSRLRLYELIGVDLPVAAVAPRQLQTENFILKKAISMTHKLGDQSDELDEAKADAEHWKKSLDAYKKRYEAEVAAAKRQQKLLEAKLALAEYQRYITKSVCDEKVAYAIGRLSEIKGRDGQIAELQNICPSSDEKDKEQSLKDEVLYWMNPDRRAGALPTPEPQVKPIEKCERAPKKPIRNTIEDSDSDDDLEEALAAFQAKQAAEKSRTRPCVCGLNIDLADKDYFTCKSCNELRHSTNDLSHCYRWECERCNASVCMSCIKKAGGNKLHPLCSAKCGQ